MPVMQYWTVAAKDAQFTQRRVQMRDATPVTTAQDVMDATFAICRQSPAAAMLLNGHLMMLATLPLLNYQIPEPMKPTKTRREMHSELDQQVNEFLTQGGAVNEVPRGLSGRPYAQNPLVAIFEGQSQEDRTPLPGVVAAIEARRKPSSASKHHKPRPKKKIILDDFGQPLRWEWVEE